MGALPSENVMALAAPLADAHQALKINLLVLRAKNHLSQAELAKAAGVSRTVISDLEQGRGDTRLGTLARIAFVLKTTIAELLTPWQPSQNTEEEFVRRAHAPEDEFIDADDFLAALDEASEPSRYSRRGRKPTVARSTRNGSSEGPARV
jgi:transcriptional regulator with XRE-family HTH domain